MSTTYTRVLIRAEALGPGSGVLATVPADVLWVVRGVAYRPGPSFPCQSPGMFIVTTDLGALPLCGVGSADSIGGHMYSEELRQVLNAGETLDWVADSGGWACSVTGYVFNV